MVDESVLPEDVGTGAPYGDFDDAANLASMVHRPNSTDFVISGIGLNPDYDDMMCYTDAGRAIVGDTDAQATESDELREYGVAYSAILKARTTSFETNNDVLELVAGINHVHVAVDLEEGDSPYIYVDQDDSGPADPSFKIGTVDTDTETVEELGRDPTATFEEVTSDNVATDTINDTAVSEYLSGQSATVESTDTSTNLNSSSWNTLSWDTESFLDSDFYTLENNGLTVEEAGTYMISVNVYFYSDATRDNPNMKLAKNGSRFGPRAGTGYVRNNDGHSHSSLGMTHIEQLEAGDSITTQFTREANSGTANAISGENSFSMVKMG
jgi:hypothetical protein